MSGLLTFGESMGLINADGIGTLDLVRRAVVGIGGAESNVAIGVARLGQPATWIGRIGTDAIGDLIVRRLREAGVTVTAVRDRAGTGLMVRHRRFGGGDQVDYHRSGSAGSRLRADDIPAHAVAAAGILHITGVTPALGESARAAVGHAVEAAATAGTTLSLDVNYRSRLWDPDVARATLGPLVRRTEIVFAGIAEAQLLLGTAVTDPLELAHRLAALGPAEAIVKTGAEGCVAVIGGQVLQQAAPAVTVVDPVGAGDAFVAGYLADRMAGAGPAERLRTACATGAYAVAVPGDCELLPTRADLAALLTTADVLR